MEVSGVVGSKSHKKSFIESSEEAWSVIVSERDLLGFLRTDITLVDMWGEKPGPIIYYYVYNRRGKSIEDVPPTLCYGYLAENRYKPLAHVIKDIDHKEFIDIAMMIQGVRSD